MWAINVSFIRAAVLAPSLLAGGCGEVGPPDAHDESGVTLEQATQVAERGRQLAVGRAHGCSLDPQISGLLCWGDNARGQASVPPLLSAPRFVAAGGDTTCAIAAAGVVCWGDNARGQRNVPRGLASPKALAVGEAHACALTGEGAVRCWGDDTHGQLRVPALADVRAIAAGARHTCALTATGVVCWGDNALGQCDVPALARPTQLAVGRAHGCAIDGARIACWGGDVPALRDAVPVVTAPTALAAGGSHSCVVDAGRVACWGASPLSPRELTRPLQIAVGGSGAQAFACARHLQGVACWGDDSLGQARYRGGPLHVLHRSTSEIHAPPARVWAILMDLDGYPRWNPYTTAMKSTLELGAPMVMTVKMNASTTIEQTENIRVIEPGHKICWGIDTATPALNSGERCQWLEPLPDGRTRYVTEDLIEGTLNPIVSALFGGDVQRGFDAVAAALAAYAERGESVSQR